MNYGLMAYSQIPSPMPPPPISMPQHTAPAPQPPQQQQSSMPDITQRQVTYQTGEIYIGQWMQVSPQLGYPHGWGRKYGNNEFYEGQWSEGLKHGQGTKMWGSGEKYEGGWKDNKRQGYGIQ